MRTVKEVSKLTGVSVRTLHHYHAIGLLAPTCVTESGYRLYDDEALSRLQNILFFRELEFPLKDIKALLDSPDFDREEALSQQIRLLCLEKERLEKLILLAQNIQKKGDFDMNFEPFDKSQIEDYKEEVKERWGSTEAYAQYNQKAASGKNFDEAAKGLMDIFARFGQLRDLKPDDPAVQELVASLRDFITANYYDCSVEILSGLGKMYTADPRFSANIDKSGGAGTADFASEAIGIYCCR